MSDQTYRIKPLVWERASYAFREEWWCNPLCMRYAISRTRKRPDGPWSWWRLEMMACGNYSTTGYDYYYYDEDCPKALHRSLQGAMAAAEAHWRETITRFLEEVNHE